MSLARLLEKRTHLIPGKLKVSELFFEVPKDYSKPSDGKLRIFARSAEKAEKPVDPPTTDDKKQLPWFVYLQGGPGFGCAPPGSYPATSFILDKGYQMLYIDQRGTGLSSPISASTLPLQGSPENQAEYLKLFRADSIVRDCEEIRKLLTKDYPEEKRKWSILGQSFGGFCAITYLSKFPQGLREVFLCGGLAPIVNNPDIVYRNTYRRVEKRNKAFYEKYPEDIERVKSIVNHLDQKSIALPSGGTLSPSRFLQIGINFGGHGGLDSVHDVVLTASTDLKDVGFLTRPTLARIEGNLSFDDAVIYAILHESIYCQGEPSTWSADRLLAEYPQFDIQSRASTQNNDEPVLFRGEMIYREMFESFSELRKIREAAEIVANMTDWPTLYDEEQLAKNEVPVFSSTYMEDMYVDFDLAQQTASKIKNCQQFIANRMYHDAFRSKSDEVMRQLFALRDDSID